MTKHNLSLTLLFIALGLLILIALANAPTTIAINAQTSLTPWAYVPLILNPKATPTYTPTNTPTSTPTNTPTPTNTSIPPSDVQITHVEYNPPGDDVQGEYVRLHNYGGPQNLTNWTLSDQSAHVYTFPPGYTLASATDVRIWTKAGTDTQTDLYWGSAAPIWTNTGDTAYLRDHNNQLIDTYSW